MGLPTSRDESVVANGTVKSSLLNNMQDCIVGGKHGSVVRILCAAGDSDLRPSATPPAATDFFINSNGDRAGRTGSVVFGIPLLVGEKVTAVKVVAKDVSTGTKKFYGQVFERNLVAGTRTSKSDNTASAGDGTAQSLTLTNLNGSIIGATGKRYEVDVTIDAGAGSDFSIAQVEVTYEST